MWHMARVRFPDRDDLDDGVGETVKLFNARKQTPVVVRFAWIALLALMVAACGPLGDDDEEPTPTSEPNEAQPTVPAGADASPAATQQEMPPANIDLSSPVGAASPESGVAEGSPAASQDGAEDATPAPAGTAGEADASPAAPGDGTTGADAGTSPAATAGTPPPDGSPAAGTPVTGTAPTVVTSCAPEDVPAFTGEKPSYVVLEELNFRVGPGSDCDLIGEGPLVAGVGLTVRAGPVVREGENDLQWLQVEVAGVTGWVAADFVAPAE
jgi:hypothetical protein